MKNKIFWTLAAAGLGLMAITQAVQAHGDVEDGKAKFHSCLGCHGIPGYSNSFPAYHVPSIGGQHAEYVVTVLKSYASGARKHSSMSGQSSSMSEQDMQDLAAYIASNKGKPPSVTVKGDATAGKKNANQTCASCHGKDGNSSNHNNPRLAGQYENFLVKAMQDYKTSARKNPIMQGMVQNLSDQDINDLAAYFASQKNGLTSVAE